MDFAVVDFLKHMQIVLMSLVFIKLLDFFKLMERHWDQLNGLDLDLSLLKHKEFQVDLVVIQQSLTEIPNIIFKCLIVLVDLKFETMDRNYVFLSTLTVTGVFVTLKLLLILLLKEEVV